MKKNIQIFILLLLVSFLSPNLDAQISDKNKFSDFIGPFENIGDLYGKDESRVSSIKSVEKILAYRIFQDRQVVAGERIYNACKGSQCFHEYHIKEGPKEISGEILNELKEYLLNIKNFENDVIASALEPEFAFRIIDNNSTIDFMFDVKGGNLEISWNDSEHTQIFNDDAFIPIVKKIFVDDPEIQQLKSSHHFKKLIGQ